MRKHYLILAAFCAAAFVVPGALSPARAHLHTGIDLQADDKVDESTIEKRDEVDRKYRATRSTIPAQTSAIDPWANMRGADEKKPAPKPAAKPMQTSTQKTSDKKKPAAQ